MYYVKGIPYVTKQYFYSNEECINYAHVLLTIHPDISYITIVD